MAEDLINSFMTGPDENGRFGDFGGRFVSETLMPLILDLEARDQFAKTDPLSWAEMDLAEALRRGGRRRFTMPSG